MNTWKSFQIVHKSIDKGIGILSPVFPEVMFCFSIDKACIFYKV